MSDATKGWRWEPVNDDCAEDIERGRIRLIGPDNAVMMDQWADCEDSCIAADCGLEMTPETCARIAACLNACEGKETEDLYPRMIVEREEEEFHRSIEKDLTDD